MSSDTASDASDAISESAQISDSPDYQWLYSRSRAGRARDPQRMRDLLAKFTNPDTNFIALQIVGSNGKGSVGAMLEAALVAADKQVGCFSSPHLQNFEERIRLNGQQILPEQTAQFIEWAKHFTPNTPFFEQTLLLACQIFASAEVQWAIVEAGIGGASDSSSALQKVAAVVCTNIGLDHQNLLGNSVAQITRDKAGAARAGVPFVTTAKGEAHDVAQQLCVERQAPFYSPQTHPQLFELPEQKIKPEQPHSYGYQLQNAQLATATLRLLGYDSTHILAMPQQTHLPARLEHLQLHGKNIWLDGAHNAHATQALAHALPLIPAGPIDALLFGQYERKDSTASLAPLLALTSQRFFTLPITPILPTSPATTTANAPSPELLALPQQLAKQYDGTAISDPTEALAQALAAVPDHGHLLVTGSLHLVGLLRSAINKQLQTPTLH